MRWLALLAALLIAPVQAAEETPRFAIYYTAGEPASAFEPYSLLVLDKEVHPELRPLKSRGKTLLAYLSIGESANYRPFAQRLKAQGLLLGPAAEDRRAIDVRDPAWAAYIVEVLVPDILARGFDGVMLDTADTALTLEHKDAKKYAGMKEGLINLIRTLRLHYPDIRIMLNRGFDILPEIAGYINYVLAESIYSTLDKNGAPQLQPEAHYASVSDMLKRIQKDAPNLAIYTVDYWPEADKEGTRRIYAAQRAQGFVPYVSTPELQHIAEEP